MAQTAAFDAKPQRSKVRYPDSRHNKYPSEAIDIGPVLRNGSIPWNDTEAWIDFGLYAKECAERLGIADRVEWGGEIWPNFKDYPHWQIKTSFLNSDTI